jgi:hypothetical protein
LQRVDVWVDYSNAQDRTIVLCAIQEKSVGEELLSIAGKLIAALRIFCG